MQRYQARLLAFCRHMLASTEDAEDVLQEVFAAAFNAICADERPINARPWLYRIARNRCLNHLRRPVPNGQDSMDIFERDGGQTTADMVHKREEFRQVVADVQELPETQKTALLLREMDALSYEHIAEAMDTTVPSVKSLLVRARVSLGEAAEARLLTCSHVRLELGEVAEGLAKLSQPARRHLKGCERCRIFRGELRRANRALAAVYPIGPLILVKKLLLTKVGLGAGATTGGSGAGLAGGAAAGSAAGGGGMGGFLTAGLGALATKAAAGFAAAAIVTAGAVESTQQSSHHHASGGAVAAAVPTPTVIAAAPQAPALGVPVPAAAGHSAAHPAPAHPAPAARRAAKQPGASATASSAPAATTTPTAALTPAPASAPAPSGSSQASSPPPPSSPPSGGSQQGSSTVTINSTPGQGTTGTSSGSGSPNQTSTPQQAPPPQSPPPAR